MSPVTTVIFDMYQTLAENNSGHWLDTFEKIVQEQGLEIDPSVLRQVWQAQGRQFSQSRITSGAEFLSYFQSWCAAFTEAFRGVGIGWRRGGCVEVGHHGALPEAAFSGNQASPGPNRAAGQNRGGLQRRRRLLETQFEPGRVGI